MPNAKKKPVAKISNLVYVCKHCKSFNVQGPVCGCQASRIEAGREIVFAGAEMVW